MADTQLDYFKDVDIVLDYADQNISQKIFAAEGDIEGRTLTVQVTNKGRVSEIIGAVLRAVWKNEATGISDITAFDEIDSSNGLFELTYPTHMMTRGNVKMQIQIVYQGATTMSRPFNITVTGIDGNFRAIIESQQFLALVNALNQAKTSVPVDALDSYSAMVAKYPNGANGTVLAKQSDGYHSYMWQNGSWKDLGIYQSSKLSDSEIDRVVSAAYDETSLYNNKLLYPEFKNNIVGFGSITSQITQRNSRNWAQFVSTDGKLNSYAAVDLKQSSDLFWYGGEYTLDFYQQSSKTSDFEFYVYVFDKDNKASKVVFNKNTVLVNKLTRIKGTFASLRDLGFDYDNVTKLQFVIKPLNQSEFNFMIKDLDFLINNHLIIDKALSDEESSLMNKFNSNEWYNNSMLSNFLEDPVKVFSCDGSIMKNRGFNWYRAYYNGAANSNNKYVQIDLNVTKDSDRFWYGADGHITLYNNELFSKDYELFLYVYDINNVVKRHTIKTVKLNSKTTIDVEFDYPSLKDLGYDYNLISYSSFNIRCNDQTSFDFSFKDLHFNTKPQFVYPKNPKVKNWIRNNDYNKIYSLPFLSRGTSSSVVYNNGYYWAKLTRTNDDTYNAYQEYDLDMKENSDRFWYGGEASVVVRDNLNDFNDVEIYMYVYQTTTEEVRRITIKKVAIAKNQTTRIKFEVPSLRYLGFDYNNLKSASLCVRPVKQEKIDLQVADLTIKTKDIKELLIQNETNFDGVTSQLPRLDFKGDFASLNATNKIPTIYTLTMKDRVIDGYSETKWQGNSSLLLPKKNFRLKSYSDETLKKASKKKIIPDPKMAATEKFNIKANYIDRYQARNLVCSELAYEMYNERYHNNANFDNLPYGGQVQGFPVTVWWNGFYYGLGTFNTAKSDEMFNVSDEEKHIVITGNNASNGNKFLQNTITASVDDFNSDFEIMFPEQDPNEYQQNAMNELATFINSSTDDEFKKNLESHYSLITIIDWLLLLEASANNDMYAKNIIHITYDGKKWFALPYDQDNVWGVSWQGDRESDTDVNFLDTKVVKNKLLTRVVQNFPQEIVKRYDELVSKGILTAKNVVEKFDKYVNEIGQANYDRDKNNWNNPAYDLLDYDRTVFLIRKRFRLLSEHINKLR